MCFVPICVQFLISQHPRISSFWTLRSPKTIKKNGEFRDFDTFSPSLIFFLLTLSSVSLTFSILTGFSSVSFSSLAVPTTVAARAYKSEVWLLNFLRWYTACIHIQPWSGHAQGIFAPAAMRGWDPPLSCLKVGDLNKTSTEARKDLGFLKFQAVKGE